jgi:hypothetical protein
MLQAKRQWYFETARIGNVMIPDRHKTASTSMSRYHGDTDIIFLMILDDRCITSYE